MHRPPIKTFVFMAILVAGGFALFFTSRRMPACSGDARYMSTQSQCQAYGVDAGVCKEAVDKAREIVTRAAPKADTLFQCEILHGDCFETPAGGFVPMPSFCLRPSGAGAPQPTEVRYLEYTSDRMNRKKTHEVRID